MSRPIVLTEQLFNQAVEEFKTSLSNMKMSEGKITYNKSFTYKGEDKAYILFKPTAYAKMVRLIESFSSEVAWHGVGERVSEGIFLITDILVYPQTVTGSTVNMDEGKYAMWLMENADDERFDHIVMQGHSHVRMSTSPSAVDKTHQEEILNQLRPNMFYIFMIWNKHMEHTTKIFDMENNVLYEDSDIEYGIYADDCNLKEFTEAAKDLVVEVKAETKPTNYGGGYSYGDYKGGYNGYNGGGSKNTTSLANKSKQKGKSEFGSGWQGRGSEDMDDNIYDYYKHNKDDFHST